MARKAAAILLKAVATALRLKAAATLRKVVVTGVRLRREVAILRKMAAMVVLRRAAAVMVHPRKVVEVTEVRHKAVGVGRSSELPLGQHWTQC